MSIERWWEEGERIAVAGHRIYVRRLGSGPHMTLLHGFPSSSHDYAKLAPGLAERCELLLIDFLGFGASDKPREHAYSIHEQADVVEAVWEHLGVTSTRVAAHDYAVSVAQELLAREARTIADVTFMNGGLYPDVHRPEPMQTALLDPEQGPQISANVDEELMTAAIARTWGDGYDGTQDAHDIWASLARDDGQRNLHLLIRYMADRREHEQRWVRALEGTPGVPKAFVWGMQDPVSGAHMAERIRERLPDAPFTALDDVGHWPPVEAPDRVAAALLG